jgi:Flp pilus assembly protein TadD
MKRAARILAIPMALAFAQSLAAMDLPEPKPKPVSPSLEAGRKAVEAKDFNSALTHLVKAVVETPDDADVHNLLGYSHRKLGQFDKAMEQYQLALKLDRNHRGAHEYLGELYLEMGQLDNAEKQLQALNKACPWFGKCEEYEDLKDTIEKYKAKKTN